MITEEQFIKLYAKYESELRSFARSLTPQREDSSDVIQDACIAMWKKIHTLESSKAFRRWAYSYVRLTAMNYRRKKKSSRLEFSGELMELMADEWEKENDLITHEQLALDQCLKNLSTTQRNILGQYYSSKTTVLELSDRLDKPASGIYKTLERARAALRKCVSQKIKNKEVK